MPKIQKKSMRIHESRMLEHMRAEIEQNRAITDYIAMMAEVPIPEIHREKEEGTDGSHEE